MNTDRYIGIVLNDASIERLCTEFGARVRAARKEAGLTPKALASLVGLSRSSIANLEAGRQRIPVHVIWNLADALGVSVSVLLPEPSSGVVVPRPKVTRFLRQEPRLAAVSANSKQRVREFVEAKLAEGAGIPSAREG